MKFKLVLFILCIALIIPGCITVTTQQPQQPSQSQPTSPAAVSPPVIEYFEAAPAEVAFGSSSTLKWNVTGADSVQITPDIGNVGNSGETAIIPQQRMVYTLTASNGGGDNTATVTVTVNQNTRAKPIALTEEDVMPDGFVYDSSSEPSTPNTISTYHILFKQGAYSNTILDNTVYIYDTITDLEAVFATDFVAIGNEGYVLTINSSSETVAPTYSLKFYKNNVYVKLTGNIPLNQLEKFARMNESRIY